MHSGFLPRAVHQATTRDSGECVVRQVVKVSLKNISIYSLIKAVAILYEVIQFLSGIFNDIFVELNSVVYTKWP